MPIPTWVDDDYLPIRDRQGLAAVMQKWNLYRDTYQAKYEDFLQRQWSFHDTWEDVPGLTDAVELEFTIEDGHTWAEVFGEDWMPNEGNAYGIDISDWFIGNANEETFRVAWHLFTHVPSGMEYSDEGITLNAFTSARVLIRMHQLLVAQCIEQCLCLSNRGRPCIL